MRRFLGFLFFLSLTGCFALLKAQAGNDLFAGLPAGAKILQIVSDPGFDGDQNNELLTLVEVNRSWHVVLLDDTVNGYIPAFQAELGAAEPFVSGALNEPYAVLNSGDINGDGIADFWLIYFNKEKSVGELQVFVSANGTYKNAADVLALYDLDFANYQGDFVIHEVDRLPGEETLRLHSYLWRQDHFDYDDQEYVLTPRDYQLFIRKRWRPQLFPGKNGTDPSFSRWAEELLTFADRPQGRTAVTDLLPEKAYLLNFLPDQALDLDTDTEYLIAYLVPDFEDPRRVLLKAAVADWDPGQRKHRLIPLDEQDYGLARHPEGHYYQPIYLLRGNGLDHPMVLGNAAPDKPLIRLKIFTNTGKGFINGATFEGNLFLQLIEHVAADGDYFRVVVADQAKDGRVQVTVKKAFPEGDYGACGVFREEQVKVMSLRDFKQEFYSSEETEWISGGYEIPLLRTNHPSYSIVPEALPGAEGFKGSIEDYLLRHMADLKIRSWLAEDFDGDGLAEGLALMKTDDQTWPPVYHAGYFSTNGFRITASLVGPGIRPDDRNPPAGIYLVDIDRDKQREMVIVARGVSPETRREGVFLEVRRLTNGTWLSVHPREIWYDDLRLFASAQGIELAGFVLDANRKPQGTVYEFLWKEGGFRLRKKEPVSGFELYLRRSRSNSVDLLSSPEAKLKLR